MVRAAAIVATTRMNSRRSICNVEDAVGVMNGTQGSFGADASHRWNHRSLFCCQVTGWDQLHGHSGAALSANSISFSRGMSSGIVRETAAFDCFALADVTCPTVVLAYPQTRSITRTWMSRLTVFINQAVNPFSLSIYRAHGRRRNDAKPTYSAALLIRIFFSIELFW
jgi:hypothetical protein